MDWTVLGHLPNVVRESEASIEGVVVKLTAEQLQRLETARLVPALYQWRRVTPIGPRGRSRALMLHVPDSRDPGTPNPWVWREVLTGAIAAGLSDRTIRAIASARANEANAVLAGIDYDDLLQAC